MVERNAPLTHHLLGVEIAHAVTAIPPHRPEHDFTLEVTPPEVRHPTLLRLAPAYPDNFERVCH
jgi:hypothetical protein